jgi:hypothetical protein
VNVPLIIAMLELLGTTLDEEDTEELELGATLELLSGGELELLLGK